MAHGAPTKQKTNSDLDSNDDDSLPPPPDGGWGWVVVAASFLIHIITDGMTYSFGILYVEFLSTFNEGGGYTSWILSIMVGMTLCSGPISSSFVNRYGCRVVTIAGSILASVCLLASVHAQNVLTLIFTIGIGTGFGLGLIYLPAIVSVTTYFDKYRSLATGIAVCGSGFGTFLFAPLLDYFIKGYQWRGALFILAGIVLNCAIFGALFRPLKRTNRPTITEEPDTYQQNGTYDIETSTQTHTRHYHSNGHLHLNHNQRRRSRNSHSFHVPSVNVISEGGLNSVETQLMRSHSVGHNGLLQKSSGESDGLLNASNGLKNGKTTKSDGIRSTLSQPLLINSSSSDSEQKPLKGSHSQKIWRSGTLSRPDVFYQGSLCNIPNYRSHGELSTIIDRYGSLRHIDENEEDTASREVCCGCIPADTHETFVEMMNFGLFKDPIFIVFTLSNFCTSLGFNVPYVYLAPLAEKLQLPTEQASYLLSIIGIANTVGRIVLGYLSDKPWVNRLAVYNVCLAVCGGATALSVYCDDFYSLAIYSSVFGFTIGAYVGLTSVILVDLLGLEKLTNAFGLLLLFQGIASFAGPPIVGSLYDYTNSYVPGFLFAGSMIGISGLMLFIIPPLQAYLDRQHMRVSTTADGEGALNTVDGAHADRNLQIS